MRSISSYRFPVAHQHTIESPSVALSRHSYSTVATSRCAVPGTARVSLWSDGPPTTPLTSDTPSFTLIQRANSEIRRVQFGLSLDSKADLRYPEESRERNRSERMDRNLTARFGVSRETAKDFMLAFGRALHSDSFRVSVLPNNIVKPFYKTLHSTLLLYVVFGSLPEKRGKDVEPTCDQVQVAYKWP